MAIYSYKKYVPTIKPSAFVHDNATVIGNCVIGENSSIWPGAVIRADNDLVMLGDDVNVQDGAVIHVDVNYPALVGNGVSIAHLAMVHGATIGENTLIGMQSVVMNDAVIGKNCIIGANTVITAGTKIPDNSLVIGSPGKVVRQVTEEEIVHNRLNAKTYSDKSATYKIDQVRIK